MLVDCLKYVDLLLERVPDHVLVDQLFSKNKELCKIVILSANKRLSLGYVNRTLKLAVHILQLGKFLSPLLLLTRKKKDSDSTIIIIIIILLLWNTKVIQNNIYCFHLFHFLYDNNEILILLFSLTISMIHRPKITAKEFLHPCYVI